MVTLEDNLGEAKQLIKWRDVLVGGGGQGNTGTSHINQVFIPNDLFNVWILSTLLSLWAGLFPVDLNMTSLIFRFKISCGRADKSRAIV